MKTVKVYIGASWNKYLEKFVFTTHACDMTEYGYHTIEVVDLPVNFPGEEVLRNKVVQALIAQKNKVLAEARVKAQGLQKEAYNLLALSAPKQDDETAPAHGLDDSIPF
jgi:hypothetical protein